MERILKAVVKLKAADTLIERDWYELMSFIPPWKKKRFYEIVEKIIKERGGK